MTSMYQCTLSPRGLLFYGQLGNGAEKNISKPEKIMNDVIAVSCGRFNTAAIKSDGSLWMWGLNLCGQLGNNLKGNVETPSYGSCQTVPLKIMDNVVAIGCGDSFTAAIKTDGTLWMWGDNDDGQLGNGGNGNVVIDTYNRLCVHLRG